MIVAVMVMSMVVFVSLVVAAVLVPMLVVMMGVIMPVAMAMFGCHSDAGPLIPRWRPNLSLGRLKSACA